MAEHFRHEIVEAGEWRRYTEPEGAHGGSNEDRPHFVARTEAGDKLVALDVSGVIGHTGLCPGWVKRPDGTEVRAYRFRVLEATADCIERMLGDMDDLVVRFLQSPVHGGGR